MCEQFVMSQNTLSSLNYATAAKCSLLFVSFLTVQDGKKLQILPCENSLASRHAIWKLSFLYG